MDNTIVWTDAAVVGSGSQSTLHKQKRVGWAWVAVNVDGVVIAEDSGRLDRKTHSVMAELHAVIQALSSIYSHNAYIHTDCQHVARLFAGEHLRYSTKKSLAKARIKAQQVNAKIKWVRSHGGDLGATRADTLARDAIGLPPSNAWGIL